MRLDLFFSKKADSPFPYPLPFFFIIFVMQRWLFIRHLLSCHFRVQIRLDYFSKDLQTLHAYDSLPLLGTVRAVPFKSVMGGGGGGGGGGRNGR